MLIRCAIALFATASLLADANPDLSALTESHTQFAFSLYPTIDTPETNLVFSPYSIASCLSMVYFGARGNTESQMQKALHLTMDRKNIAKISNTLDHSLLARKSGENDYKLSVANAIWVGQGTFLLTDFRYAIEQQFKAKLAQINFTQSANALATINTWVSLQTQNKITNLLLDTDINELTRLVLTNAVYFQGSWVSPFDPKATQDWPFHPTPDTSLTVKMLHQTLNLPYYENDLMQAAALPFLGTANGGGTLGFVFLLPKSADNLTAMFNELGSEFNHWLSALTPQRVELKLPKFTQSSHLSLNAPLQQLGMEDPFDSNANFMGIDGMRDLFLNKVVHQAFFALDEFGVTAAASTGASMNVTSAPQAEPPIPLTLDHPFLFFIVDLKSKEVLFMGKVVSPGL